jgi:hypothetical protein
MSQDDVERLLGRLITDECFRQTASDSLPTACHLTGFQLNATEIELLSGLNIDWFKEIGLRIDGRLCRVGKKPGLPVNILSSTKGEQ